MNWMVKRERIDEAGNLQSTIVGYVERPDLTSEADLGVSGILCARPVASSRLNEPLVEHDGELGLCLEPLARRHFPLPGGLAQDEKQELRGGVIGGKMTSRAYSAA